MLLAGLRPLSYSFLVHRMGLQKKLRIAHQLDQRGSPFSLGKIVDHFLIEDIVGRRRLHGLFTILPDHKMAVAHSRIEAEFTISFNPS